MFFIIFLKACLTFVLSSAMAFHDVWLLEVHFIILCILPFSNFTDLFSSYQALNLK